MKWFKKMSLAAITGLSLLGLSACSSQGEITKIGRASCRERV